MCIRDRICPLVMDRTLLRRDWPLSLLAAVMLCAMIAPDLTLSRLEGAVLLAVFALTQFLQIHAALTGRSPLDDAAEDIVMPPLMIGVNILLGLASVSYTHLDVYKRQLASSSPRLKPRLRLSQCPVLTPPYLVVKACRTGSRRQV